MDIIATENFIRSAKPLAKKYRSFNSDYQNLLKELNENPNLGVDLGAGLRKVRMAISSKGKGKSGGARVITLDVIERCDVLYLLEIYDKSDADSVNVSILRKIVEELGLGD